MRHAIAAEEAALRAVVSDAEALLAPLLMPLMPLLSAAPALGAASLTVWLVLPPALAALPLELLPALRMPHVTSVGRDLSVSVLAKRLGHADGATCKKGSVGYAVDPRDEVTLPADAVEEKKTGSKPGSAKTKKGQAAAAEAEAPAGAPPSQSLCTAFERDILSGARVGYAKDWPKALLGSAAVPSAAQWQRTLRGAGAFLFLGPGPLLAQLKPEHIASLPLDGVACALLLDRLEADAASRRLAKEDNAKLPRHLALEEAHTAAALLSLAGVRSVVINQWSSTPAVGRELLTSVLAQLGAGESLGDALHKTTREKIALDKDGQEVAPSAGTTPRLGSGSQKPTPRGSQKPTPRSGTPPRTGTAGSKGTASPKGSKPGTAKGRKAAKATKGMNELDNPRSQQSTLGNAIVYGLAGFRFA